MALHLDAHAVTLAIPLHRFSSMVGYKAFTRQSAI